MKRAVIYTLLGVVILLTVITYSLTSQLYGFQQDQIYHAGDKAFYESIINR